MTQQSALTISPKKIGNDSLISALFLAPTIILITCITLIPICIAIRTSFHATQYAQVNEFVGFSNYIEILGNPSGWSNILNSITYVLMSLALVIPLGVIIGVLLNQKLKGQGLMRTMIIIPWVLSQTVTALLWKWLLNSNFGPIVYLWYNLTGVKIDFLNSEISAKITLVLANVWNTLPIAVILTLAALQSISPDIYEAAQVDGAGRLVTFFNITLPLIKPTIITILIQQSMEYFNMVTLIYVMTSGGPFGATETLSVRAFKEGFDYWHMGLGSAYSVIIFIFNILFSVIYISSLRKKEMRDEN